MQTYEIKVFLTAGPAIVYDRAFRDRAAVREYIEHVSTHGVWNDDVLFYPAHRILRVEVEPVE